MDAAGGGDVDIVEDDRLVADVLLTGGGGGGEVPVDGPEPEPEVVGVVDD